MYRKIAVSERLPDNGKPVITIDSEGNAFNYERFGDSWRMVNASNNQPIVYWLEWVEDGSIGEAFKNFIDKADSEEWNTIVMTTPNSGKDSKFHIQGNVAYITQMITQFMQYSEELAEVFTDAVDAFNDEKDDDE